MQSSSAPVHPSFARLVRWATLWLFRLAEFVRIGAAEGFEAPLRPFLRELRTMIAAVILVRACQRAVPRKRHRRYGPHRDGRNFRAAIGAELRRALRGRGVVHAIANLLDAIARMDALVAQLARRLRRGLTRGDGAFAHVDDAVSAFSTPAHARTDTS